MPHKIDALIVGAGFAGLYALYKMREIGVAAHAFEMADDVGGVWYWNRYPGARCDVESVQYSYSFSDDLQQEWDWTERFARQPEILAYLNHVADRFDLRRSISFGTSIVSAQFDDGAQVWNVRDDKGEEYIVRYCIMASGSLSASRLPDLPGIEDFEGPVLHTGAWPEQAPDFTHRNVAVIGTGSSGVQAVPQIAKSAKHLYVFQRTPNFVIPARNQPLAPEAMAKCKAEYPAIRARAKQVGTLYDFSETAAFAVSSQEREAEYQHRWNQGGVNFVHAFKDIMTDLAANQTAADFVHARIREVVDDPVVAEQLCPKDYPLGAKRICVGADYYETYNRPNVTLVDLQTTPITQVHARAIQTSDTTIPIDMIVCATGYDALTGALARIDIRGRGGVSLTEKWAAGPRNYLGLMCAEFPNMFIITGPGSPSVLVNMVVGIEQHVDWIADCIVHLETNGATSMVPTAAAESQWVQRVNDEADQTLFPKASSWYLGANIPGKPRVFMPFVGGIGRYRAICDQVAADGYSGFEISQGD
jgi:cyclohexanone monooxygenase